MNRNAVPYHSPGSRSHPGAAGTPLTHENPERVPYFMQPFQGWDLQGGTSFSQGIFATLGLVLERRWRSFRTHAQVRESLTKPDRRGYVNA